MCPACDVPLLESVDASAFKAAMRRIASTVTVVTSASGSDLNGMTATAVCSVSVTPPSVLVVINQANRSHALIDKADVFAVNVLSEGQKYLAQHFALKSDNPLDKLDYRTGLTGAPILAGCVAHLECVVESKTRFGTHSIFIGRVVNSMERSEQPLLHFNGDFVKLESC